MLYLEILILVVFTLAAVFYALLGLYAWKKRPAAGVTYFAWVMVAMAAWSFTYALEIFLPGLVAKIFMVNLEYIAISCVPIFLFLFALDHTGRSHLITNNLRRFFWAFLPLSLLFVWTNPFHRIMWDMEQLIPFGSLSLLSIRFGVGFWLYIFIVYSLVFTAGTLLVMDYVQRPGSLRLHISFVILGLLFSFAGTMAFTLGLNPIQGLDFAPLLFLPAAIGLAWVTLRYRLSEVISLEHITVLKSLNNGVIVLNSQKRILYINRVAESLMAVQEDQVIGQPIYEAMKPLAGIKYSSTNGAKQRSEIRIDTGGTAQTLEVVVSSLPAERSTLVNYFINLYDVTERKEKEEGLSRHRWMMSAISRAADRFLRSENWEEHISHVLKTIGLTARLSYVHILFHHTELNESYAVLQYEWAAEGNPRQINSSFFKHIHLHATQAASLAKGNSIDGLVRDLPYEERELFNALGSISFAAAPIFVDSVWWASIFFHDCLEERTWGDIELEAFQTAASILGAAETQSRTRKQLIRRQLALELLQGIVTASLQAQNMLEMGEKVTNNLAQLIDADGCFLTLWDKNNNQTIPFAAYGALKQAYTEIEIEPGEVTFTRSVLDLERTLIIKDTENTPYASPSITKTFPSKSLLALPLIANKKKLGAVLVSFDEYHKFLAEEVNICEQAASLIALALEKFQAVEDAKRRADTSETLRKAGLAVAEQANIDETVKRILDQIHLMVPYRSASVQLLRDNELEIIGGHGWEDTSSIIGMRFPIPGDNPNTAVIESGLPLYLPYVAKKYKQFSQPPHNHIRSWMGIPLKVQEKTIGLLSVESSDINGFSDQEIMIATEFANQVAVTLENARILKESQIQAVTDALTGILNRRGLFETGEYEFQRARRIHRPFSILMFDIDHFKKVNDKFGHAVGDQILYQLGQHCVKNSRTTDLVARYGGEEFVILLPETNLEAARFIGERLRQSIMGAQFQTDAGELNITSSIGVTEANPIDTLQTLIERADAALYQAKNAGRNRVIVFDHTANQS